MKTKIKNLVTSALLGVAVLGGAILLQSFKEEARIEKFSQMTEVFVNSESTGEYKKLPTSADYEPLNCESLNQDQCAWQRTAKPGTVPDTFDETTAQALHAAGLIEPLDNNKGIYNDL